MICSVHVLPAMYSEPKKADSAVDCNLEYQSIGVWLNKCRIPVTALPLMRLWYRLASKNEVVVTDFVGRRDLMLHKEISYIKK